MFADHFLETKLSIEFLKGQGVHCKEMDSWVPENEPGMLTLLMVKLHQETLWPNINLTFPQKETTYVGNIWSFRFEIQTLGIKVLLCNNSLVIS